MIGDGKGGNANMIAENFSETAFVWSYKLDQKMIDYLDPDIVMLDISERGLSKYLPGLFDGYLQTSLIYDSSKGTLDIYYDDNGQYDQMYFPTWNETTKQAPVWYEAQRIDNTKWHVQVNVKDYGEGNYVIHFYDGPSGEGTYVNAATYNISFY